MTPEEMDKVLGAHFAAEAAHDLDAILATLSDDVVHDAVGFPVEKLRDPEAIRDRYRHLFTAMLDERVEPVSRLYGDDFLVDECQVTCLTGEGFPGAPAGQRVTFRLLHVCEFRDGLISRENVWQGPPVPVSE
ncbi:nuclear transport factor 2 family protein [Amycolatopsis sp. MtRt-6]|uniref:nuclear transport factor 2 family protein n=1 Tax=Amycolatopsis sp. MtRt-6 TaxID=2792782 RepID=UPI001A8FCE26|nr:nuclear transport factor 2 family protein [Amycolatopsis sp. MtRt-6]